MTVERSGSFGSANLIWSINAVSASFVPTQDVIIQSGTVTIAQGTALMLVDAHKYTCTLLFISLLYIGQTSTPLDVLVAADDFPELDETFVVTLLSVSNANQRLSTNQVRINKSQFLM